MNKELLNQFIGDATLYADDLCNRDSPTWRQFFNEKMAELIIQECMTVADLPNSVDGKYDDFLPSEMIAKHFGVE